MSRRIITTEQNDRGHRQPSDSADVLDPGLPPEELHAPDSPDDYAAVSFCTRLEGDELGVRCRIETCNAYGHFVVDGEAIFFLPAPVSRDKPEIVHEFTEQVGGLVVFPYVRSAVASLAPRCRYRPRRCRCFTPATWRSHRTMNSSPSRNVPSSSCTAP